MATQISPEQSYAYAELLEILSFTHISLVNKIPKKLISLFQDFALSTYEHHLDKNIPVEKQEISHQTAALLTLISLNYWCETEEEKNEIKAILAENEKNAAEELRKKYNPDNIFTTTSTADFTSQIENKNIPSQELSQTLPIDTTKLPWYQKIIITLKNIFSKIKNK
ncbi:MAG: hypothetical protein IJW20_02450 [Clostridia bacterium]|nr:hypothetical protein [Clostridia bacterium]